LFRFLDGIGSIIKVTPDQRRRHRSPGTQMIPVTAGCSHLSQHDLVRHFGLGRAERGDIEVTFVNGHVTNCLLNAPASGIFGTGPSVIHTFLGDFYAFFGIIYSAKFKQKFHSKVRPKIQTSSKNRSKVLINYSVFWSSSLFLLSQSRRVVSFPTPVESVSAGQRKIQEFESKSTGILSNAIVGSEIQV
jgi:hypothetical protein